MRSYDAEYLPEEEPEAIPAPLKEQGRETGPIAATALPDAARAMIPTKADPAILHPRKRTPEPGPATGPEAKLEPEPQPDAPQAAASADAAQKETEEVKGDPAARAAALASTIIALSVAPQTARLGPVFALYQDAEPAVLSQAALAMTSVLLRAPAENRPALVEVFKEAVVEFSRHDLARALGAQLGALVMAPTPEAVPPAPVEDGS